ncbi:hypothetical protein D3C85_1020970 [compost metagenome]
MNMGIVLFHQVHEVSHRFLARLCICMRIINFVANAPHDNGRMVAIPANPGGHILFRPFIKEARIVMFRFWTFPDVENFTHDKKTHFIGNIVKNAGGRVVRYTDCIDAHVTEYLKLPANSVRVNGRT